MAALGDVLRTTSILPGLARRHPGARVTWVAEPGALDLVRHHPLVDRAIGVDPQDAAQMGELATELAGVSWGRILSLDEEEPLLRLATDLAGRGGPGVLCGAHLDEAGAPTYTPDAAPWFDMGLVSHLGKARADELKRENTESHATLYARMLGIEPGEPELPLPAEAHAAAAALRDRAGLAGERPLIGLNTGAGGRWTSKRLPVERTAALIEELDRRLDSAVDFLLLGGPDEAERNARILAAVPAGPRVVDAGNEHGVLEFAAVVGLLDLLVTSDSLALHLAVSQRVPLVAFFAPTSPAEIELYGRGEKVVSTAPDACSYRPDADTSTLTVERLADAVQRVLARHPPVRS